MCQRLPRVGQRQKAGLAWMLYILPIYKRLALGVASVLTPIFLCPSSPPLVSTVLHLLSAPRLPVVPSTGVPVRVPTTYDEASIRSAGTSTAGTRPHDRDVRWKGPQVQGGGTNAIRQEEETRHAHSCFSRSGCHSRRRLGQGGFLRLHLPLLHHPPRGNHYDRS